MRQLLLTLMAFFFLVSLASADTGLISIKSSHDVKKTGDRLENALKEKGMTMFIRINHAQNAQTVGKTLRPTELIVFGNPKIGAPLMQKSQSVSIDLPQKALIWEDETGQVWFSYNDPQYMAKRHNITECDDVLKKMETALGNFAKMACMP
jgi:uncharacterized protein (DUF302 family)